MIAELFHECGAPKGLLNILHGYGAEAAAPMVEHKTVKAISFTGGICAICHFGVCVQAFILQAHFMNSVTPLYLIPGTSTGAVVAVTAAKRFAKASLELGGKNATIVFADKFRFQPSS
jgi:aminomuconate-semialdehyde/2-hydroxymuconate-6-semialdehyde dehydrogenase